MKSGPQVSPEYFDLPGASRYLGGGLSVRTLRRLIAVPGGLPFYRVGNGKILLRRADIDCFMERHRQVVVDLDELVESVLADFRN